MGLGGSVESADDAETIVFAILGSYHIADCRYLYTLIQNFVDAFGGDAAKAGRDVGCMGDQTAGFALGGSDVGCCGGIFGDLGRGSGGSYVGGGGDDQDVQGGGSAGGEGSWGGWDDGGAHRR